MRSTFIQQLALLARENPRIFLVVADLGFSVVEPFAAEFPDRFLNAGVAEQNMMGVASGLASEGYHVFTYSIANFPTLRCFEQIRNDVCYHRLPVTIVAVGAGLAYGSLGYSHHGLQDIGVMGTLGELTILSPADPGETHECLHWAVSHPGPSYLRLGKAGEPRLHEVRGIEAGPLRVRDGTSDVALVATGAILRVAVRAAELAASQGLSIPVYSVPFLPPEIGAFFRPLERFRRLVVLEEHGSRGGLACLLACHLRGTSEILPMGPPAESTTDVGSQDFLWKRYGLTPERAVELLLASAAPA